MLSKYKTIPVCTVKYEAVQILIVTHDCSGSLRRYIVLSGIDKKEPLEY